MRSIPAAAALLMLALPAPRANAQVPGGGEFLDLVRRADVIFAGTVSDAQCTRVPAGIVTRITFKRLAYVKGSGPEDSLIVRRDGGTLGAETTLSDDQPGFCVGERCVLLAKGDPGSPRNGYTPFAGVSEAVFRLFEDSPKKKPVVHTSTGTPVGAVTGGRLVLAVDENAERRMSEKAFLDALRRIVREQERPDPERPNSEGPGRADTLR